MTRVPPNSFVRALIIAVALHGAAAVVVAWCVAGLAMPVVGTGVCTVDITVDMQPPVVEQAPREPAPLQVWTPFQPQVAAMDQTGLLVPTDPPVPQSQKRMVPECIVTSMDVFPIGAEGVSSPCAVATPQVALCPQVPSGVLADSPSQACTNSSAGVSSLSDADGGLVMAGTVRPRYPASARLHGEQGSVALTVETDEDGRAQQVTVTKASGYPVLDRAAVDAARRARFVSAIAGVPARGKAHLSFRFNLVD